MQLRLTSLFLFHALPQSCPTFAVAYLFEYTDMPGQQPNAKPHAHDSSLDVLQTEQKLKQELIKMQVTSQLALSKSQSLVQQLQGSLLQHEVCVPL